MAPAERIFEKHYVFVITYCKTRNTMQWLSSHCYTVGTLIKFGGGGHLYQPPSTYQGQIWYTGVGPIFF